MPIDPVEPVQPLLARKDDPRSFRTVNAPGISWMLIVILLILLALAVIIFGQPLPASTSTGGITSSNSPSPSSSTEPRIYTVDYDAGVFSPTNLRIHAGDTVKFKNSSIFPIHVVSDDIVGFDSVGDVPQGSFFSFTFAVKGTFTYRNTHNVSQTGTIIVR